LHSLSMSESRNKSETSHARGQSLPEFYYPRDLMLEAVVFSVCRLEKGEKLRK